MRKRLSTLPLPTSLAGLRSLHQLASSYHRTPAEQLGVSDLLLSYCINTACLWAGTYLPKKLDPMSAHRGRL
jgi:hypothetical protein